VEKCEIGINVYGSSNSNILSNNTINDCDYAIALSSSSSNSLMNNSIENCGLGIYMEYDSNNNIAYKNIIRNGNFDPMQTYNAAIYIHDNCNGNTFLNNTIMNFTEAIYLSNSGGTRIENNSISQYGVGIIISNNLNTSVKYNSLAGTTLYLGLLPSRGLMLTDNTNETEIFGNHVYNSSYGIVIAYGYYRSSNNTIVGNVIETNTYGICMNSSSNFIHHNSFLNNTYQASTYNAVNVYDNGSLSGGNYWSDYKERYPNATEIDDSGFWDTPYVINENNQDNYPIVPEFPSFLILPLFMMATSLAILVYKRKHSSALSAFRFV
jgi:parallel beta-helix repeat protein